MMEGRSRRRDGPVALVAGVGDGTEACDVRRRRIGTAFQ
jgi:hypothetical protein